MRHSFLLLALAAVLPAQGPLYVDAVRGNDATGNGSAGSPWKSLTFAVSRVPQSGPATFRLRPGVYDAANGESFPIVLPESCVVEGDPATVPLDSHLAQLVTALGLATTFSIPPAMSPTVTVQNLSLSGGMFRGVQLIANQPGAFATLVLEHVSITQSRCVAAQVSGGAVAIVTISDCALNGPDTPLLMSSGTGTSMLVEVYRTLVTGGLDSGILLDASGGGSIKTLLQGCRIGGAQLRGIHAISDNVGPIVVRVENCLLHDVARNATGASVGALVDDVLAAGTAVQHITVNSIFHHNKADAQPGIGPTWLWGINLVTQQNLVSQGGNFLGTATFVDEAKDDWHLAPGSLGIDAGDPLATLATVDLDGDPRANGIPDLGPDELWDRYVMASAARIGQGFTLRTTAPPSLPFACVLGTDHVPSSFGAGTVHLAGAVFDLGVRGTTDALGIGRVSFTIPSDAALLGQVLWWQGVYAAAPYLGTNAWRMVLER